VRQVGQLPRTNSCVYLVQSAPFIVSSNTVAMAGYSGGCRLTVR